MATIDDVRVALDAACEMGVFERVTVLRDVEHGTQPMWQALAWRSGEEPGRLFISDKLLDTAGDSGVGFGRLIVDQLDRQLRPAMA